MADLFISAYTLTPHVSTGDWTTVNDKFDSTQPGNNAKTMLGASFLVIDSSGRLKRIRYVRYNSTANPAAPTAPGPVYWTDAAHTTVSGRMSEGLSTKANSIAGYLVNLSYTNGNFIFIQTAGFLSQALVAASTALDDVQIGATGDFTSARIASGAAITQVPASIALGAVSGGKADVFVDVDTL